ncbi:MAG: hypothetical protein ACXWYN_08420 [Actinomycetota bacterium]
MVAERGRESYQEAFERIEAAVNAGDSDLRALGFWRLLARVKADPALARHWADVAGRIDRTAFERRVRPRFPVWFGNAVLVLGVVVGAVAVGIAFASASGSVSGLALLVAGGVWSVAWHDLAHWLAGRLAGIRFTSYFIGGPAPPRPGLKTDYATYLRATPAARVWMHASGAIATKLAPFAALAFWPATDASAWAAWGLVALGLFEIAMDVVFSVRSSDWKKVRRELRVARRQAASG